MSEQSYLDLLKDIIEHGVDRPDRTGTGTRSVFGRQLRFDLSKGFPLITTKKVHFKSVKAELLWMLKGDTNVKWLREQGVTIWDEWADKNGDLGPIYGAQWRSWSARDEGGNWQIDQIARAIQKIKTNPNDRGIIVSAWNVGELDQMALRPCHSFFQFYVENERLSCQLYQRSADMFLGVPFNIASYALLTHMIAQVCNLKVGEFVHTFGDVHIYHNHFDQVREQLKREPKKLPDLGLNPLMTTTIDSFEMDDIYLFNYYPHPAIKAPVAI